MKIFTRRRNMTIPFVYLNMLPMNHFLDENFDLNLPAPRFESHLSLFFITRQNKPRPLRDAFSSGSSAGREINSKQPNHVLQGGPLEILFVDENGRLHQGRGTEWQEKGEGQPG